MDSHNVQVAHRLWVLLLALAGSGVGGVLTGVLSVAQYAAVPLPPPLESGDDAPSAAEAKRRVSFSAPVPPSKRALVETGIGAGWLREMARAPKVDGATNGG